MHTGKAKGRAVERGRKGGHRKGGSGKDKAARTHGTRQPTHPAGSVATFGTLLLPTALIPPPALPPRPMPLLPSYARLGVFAKGVAHGLALAGWKAPSIAPKLKKTDGTPPTPRSVNDVLAQLGADGPPWDDAPKAPHPGRSAQAPQQSPYTVGQRGGRIKNNPHNHPDNQSILLGSCRLLGEMAGGWGHNHPNKHPILVGSVAAASTSTRASTPTITP